MSLISPSVVLAPSTGKEKIGGHVRKPKPASKHPQYVASLPIHAPPIYFNTQMC